MRFFVVAGLTILGVALLICAMEGSGSLSSRLTSLVTGSSSVGSMWLFAGGALSLFTGMWIVYSRKPRQP